MTQEQERKLARIKNYRTRYEVVLTNGAERYLVQYTGQKSMNGLHNAYVSRYDAVKAIIGASVPFIARRTDVFHGNEWRLVFSGRTQREAILEGELPFASAPVQVSA